MVSSRSNVTPRCCCFQCARSKQGKAGGKPGVGGGDRTKRRRGRGGCCGASVGHTADDADSPCWTGGRRPAGGGALRASGGLRRHGDGHRAAARRLGSKLGGTRRMLYLAPAVGVAG